MVVCTHNIIVSLYTENVITAFGGGLCADNARQYSVVTRPSVLSCTLPRRRCDSRITIIPIGNRVWSDCAGGGLTRNSVHKSAALRRAVNFARGRSRDDGRRPTHRDDAVSPVDGRRKPVDDRRGPRVEDGRSRRTAADAHHVAAERELRVHAGGQRVPVHERRLFLLVVQSDRQQPHQQQQLAERGLCARAGRVLPPRFGWRSLRRIAQDTS